MDNNKRTGYNAFTLISQLGLTLAVPIILGALAGHWIDGKLGTGMIFFVLLLLLGLVGGFVGAYQQIMAVTKRKKP